MKPIDQEDSYRQKEILKVRANSFDKFAARSVFVQSGLLPHLADSNEELIPRLTNFLTGRRSL